MSKLKSNPIPTESIGSPDFITGQVSVTGTATAIRVKDTNRRGVLIVNHGTTAVYLGDSTVTTSNGLLLAGVVGASISIPTISDVYGITGGASQTVSFCSIQT